MWAVGTLSGCVSLHVVLIRLFPHAVIHLDGTPITPSNKFSPRWEISWSWSWTSRVENAEFGFTGHFCVGVRNASWIWERHVVVFRVVNPWIESYEIPTDKTANCLVDGGYDLQSRPGRLVVMTILFPSRWQSNFGGKWFDSTSSLYHGEEELFPTWRYESIWMGRSVP
jgi:hypothetical protein